MHGYEDGFHIADRDWHLTGRQSRDISAAKLFRSPSGYRHEFGDRNRFRSGYREGLRAGYADGITGRDFRAVLGIRESAAGLTVGDPRPDPAFDQGFLDGYCSGYSRLGADSATGKGGRRNPHTSCIVRTLPDENRSKKVQTYLEGFQRGYGLGYKDAAATSALPLSAAVASSK